MRMAVACLVVLVTLQGGQANASSRDVTGELRVLYALVTWGPTPFALPDAERVAAETARLLPCFVRRASLAQEFGRRSAPVATPGVRLV